MDTLQFRLVLPSDALARQVEQRLADHARTEREPAQVMGLETIALLVTIGASLVGIRATQAQTEATRAQAEANIALAQAQTEATRAQAEATRLETLKLILELQQHSQANAIRVGAPDGPLHTLADANEPLLRQLLGLPAA